MDVVNTPKIYSRYRQDWEIWCTPIREGFWWTKDYFNEAMDAFDGAKTGLKMVFIVPIGDANNPLGP